MEQSISSLVKQVKNNAKKLDELEDVVDSNEQYARLMNLRVHGLKENERETSGMIEDALLKLFKTNLKIDVTPGEIDRCYRVGKYKAGSIRPVLIRFVSFNTRSKIFNNKKLLKQTGYVIKEDLTQARLDLLKKATEKYGVKQVWTQNGKICTYISNRKKVIQSLMTYDMDKQPNG
ncbi:hypothetical protein NQ317_008015 [Molorchus minor]|uniref:Coil containing protein n=1 Tax=Molorchus minor TaxID=1323400 RepID=A0ABQ9JWT1_9CUCU|nr:hypothetical protein NQ317_008015 [Molorchus minor]